MNNADEQPEANGWEVFRSITQYPTRSMVRIGTHGVITVGVLLAEQLGVPPTVELLYNIDTQQIGIRPVGDVAHARKFYVAGQSKSRAVAAKQFIDRYGLQKYQGQTYKAAVRDGMLVISLDEVQS